MSHTHNTLGDTSVSSRNATSRSADHEVMSSIRGPPPPSPSDPRPSTQAWEFASDDGSAIDGDTFRRTLSPDPNIQSRNRVQSWSGDENRGFAAWIKSLSSPPQARDNFRTTSLPNSFHEPILVYRTKRKRLAKTGEGPLLAFKESARSQGSQHVHEDGRLQDGMDEPEPRQMATRNPSYRSPFAIDEADTPIHYDPDLQVSWRDV